MKKVLFTDRNEGDAGLVLSDGGNSDGRLVAIGDASKIVAWSC